MPYISKQDRELIDGRSDFTGIDGLDTFIEMLGRFRGASLNEHGVGYHPGTLNYIITRLCDFWLEDPNYEKYNAVIGVLECAKQELYRRQIAPYEDEKWQQNGDVYQNEQCE